MLIEISPLTSEVPGGPLVGAGTIPCGSRGLQLDIQVSILPVHPAGREEMERFNGKHLTINVPEFTLQHLQTYKEAERDDMRYTEEYAGVCRKLGYEILREMKKRNLSMDYSLAVDHAGQLITMFVAKISDIESYEIRRVKHRREDGSVDLTVLIPQNLYPLHGKKFLLLDEFINTGFTLRHVVKIITDNGGEVVMVGAFKYLEGQGLLFKEAYPKIPIVTLE